MIFPDGTQVLVDLGELDVAKRNRMRNKSLHSVPKYPDASRSADRSWRAMQRLAPRVNNRREPKIDYVVVTHFHGDHVGSRKLARRRIKGEDYARVGVIDFVLRHDVQRVYDRGTYLPGRVTVDGDEKNPFGVREEDLPRDGDILNYLAFRRHIGERVHALVPCTSDQIVPLYSKRNDNNTNSAPFAPIHLRTLKAGRVVCDSNAQQVEIPVNGRNENLLSVAFELSYGQFRYIETGDNEYDSLTPISHRLGKDHRVDVATAGHHAHGVTDELTNWQRPKVFVQQTWCADHTPEMQVRRMLSVADVYATDLHPDAVRRLRGYGDGLGRRYETMRGQISVRVYPEMKEGEGEGEGEGKVKQRFEVFVVDGRGKIVKRKEYDVVEKE